MTFLEFLKERITTLFFIICIIIIINTIIILDPVFSKNVGSLIYINVLIIFTTFVFLIISYKSHKKKTKKFIESLENFTQENEKFKNNKFYKEIKSILEEKEEEVDNLRNELEEINDYMTNWIHEVKIPIAVLEIIVKRVNEIENGRELSKQINTEVSRINKLVEQALYSSRAGNYNSDFLIDEVNLQQIVKGVVKKNKYQFIYNKINLKIGELNKIVLTDKKWISHIIELIIDNAIKYSKPEGTIEIYLKENKKGTQLHIKDNGIGIVAQDIDRIFDKGFTGENGRKRTKSTGMGLYISKKILNKLGHSIDVTSVPNEFCDVYITFYNLSDYFNVT